MVRSWSIENDEKTHSDHDLGKLLYIQNQTLLYHFGRIDPIWAN